MPSESALYKSCNNTCHSDVVHPSFSMMRYASLYQNTRFIPMMLYAEALICNQFLEDALCLHAAAAKAIPITLLQRYRIHVIWEHNSQTATFVLS